MIEIWKDVPLYIDIEASNYGRIRKTSPNGTVSYCRPFIQKAYKGYYLGTSAKTNVGKYQTIGLHVLVALAFYGVPDGYDEGTVSVNHIDGVKHNNHLTNLEWSTRTEQLLHAYETGLRSDNIEVMITDTHTGEETYCYSIAEVGRFFNVDRNQMNRDIQRHLNRLYRDRYLLEYVNLEKRVVPRFNNVRSIAGFDYKTKTLHMTDTLLDMFMISGVKPGTMGWGLKTGKKQLQNGFVFRYANELQEPWPKYTTKEINVSIIAHNKRKRDMDLPYPVIVIEVSSKFPRRLRQVYKITDLETDTTAYAATIANAAEEFGICSGGLSQAVAKRRIFKERYTVVKVKDYQNHSSLS